MKKLLFLSFILFIGIKASAQSQKHPTKSKAATSAKKPANKVVIVTKPAAVPVASPPVDTVIILKPDPVNPNYKGPYGETIYTATDGRIYYIDKNEQRIYIELEK